MRALIVVLAMLLVFPLMVESRRAPRMIAVIDHSSPVWDGVVKGVVEEFAAVLPRKRVRLVYVRRGDVCQPAVNPAQIMVCSRPVVNSQSLNDVPAAWNSPKLTIELSDTHASATRHWDARMIVCHELMHALTGIPDNNTYDPATGMITWAMPDESCVWGTLPHLGPFDVAYLKTVFGKRKHR